jgi:hypothetical protein
MRPESKATRQQANEKVDGDLRAPSGFVAGETRPEVALHLEPTRLSPAQLFPSGSVKQNVAPLPARLLSAQMRPP